MMRPRKGYAMTCYEFLIQDFDSHRMTEVVAARDDQEARSLAELRLLLSSDFCSIAVRRDGKPRFELHRDTSPPKCEVPWPRLCQGSGCPDRRGPATASRF